MLHRVAPRVIKPRAAIRVAPISILGTRQALEMLPSCVCTPSRGMCNTNGVFSSTAVMKAPRAKRASRSSTKTSKPRRKSSSSSSPSAASVVEAAPTTTSAATPSANPKTEAALAAPSSSPMPTTTTTTVDASTSDVTEVDGGDAPTGELLNFLLTLEEEARVKEAKLRNASTDNNNSSSTAPNTEAALVVERLSPEQQHAVNLALARHNLFISGSAGTGKSVVLREIVLRLRAKKLNVFVTAATGVAALHVGGSTLHSFAGVGYGQESKEELLKRVRRSRKAAGRWKYCSTLIMDEVSMLELNLLDKLDYIARAIRKKPDQPFGGIQVILCGDFLQLPPVVKTWPSRTNNKNNNKSSMLGDGGGGVFGGDEQQQQQQYCFQTEAWASLKLQSVVLKNKHRQASDEVFQHVLDEVRTGSLSSASHELLLSRVEAEQRASLAPRGVMKKDGEEGQTEAVDGGKLFVRLCGTNKEVDARNGKYFSLLPPITNPSGGDVAHDDENDDPTLPLHTYTAEDVMYDDQQRPTVVQSNADLMMHAGDVFGTRGGGDGGASGFPRGGGGGMGRARFEDSSFPNTLPLKVGTRVMLLQNVSARVGLVNGSVGEVVGFLHPLEMVELALSAGRERRRPTLRGKNLLQRGGFHSFEEVFTCVDSHHAQTLFWWIRRNHPGVRYEDQLCYQFVYEMEHLHSIQRLCGLDEVGSVDGEVLSSIHDARAEDAETKVDDDDGGNKKMDEQEDGHGSMQLLEELLQPSVSHHRRRSSQFMLDDDDRPIHLSNLLPLHRQLTRLPVVRVELPPSLTLNSSSSSSPKRPRVVHVFVSPVVQRWYMGSRVVAQRTQLPLRHAWAITVHKAQGLTIAQLEIDMARFFSPGQAYVALSRATALENVRLHNYSKGCVRACPVASDFYVHLQDASVPA